MSKFFLVAAMLVTFCALSQQQQGAAFVYTNPDVKAEFPGGLSSFYSFIAENFKTPEVEKDTEFKFYVSFIVEANGGLSDINIIRDPGLGIGAEAIRVINLSPKWIPATQDGIDVKSKITLPLIINAKASIPKLSMDDFLADVKEQQETANVKPDYPGGNTAFNNEVMRLFRAPEMDTDFDSRAFVYFVIDVDGSVIDIKCLYDPGFGICDEAVKAIGKITQKFVPAQKDGKPVPYPYVFPLRVTIQGDPSVSQNVNVLEYNEMEAVSAEFKRPTYPGGAEKLNIDFFKNFEAPPTSAAINAVVGLSFTVNVDGSMSNVRCTRDPGYGLGMEAVKALSQLKRKWVPATKNGIPVSYELAFPVRIYIEAGSGLKKAKSQRRDREVGPPIYRGGVGTKEQERPNRLNKGI